MPKDLDRTLPDRSAPDTDPMNCGYVVEKKVPNPAGCEATYLEGDLTPWSVGTGKPED